MTGSQGFPLTKPMTVNNCAACDVSGQVVFIERKRFISAVRFQTFSVSACLSICACPVICETRLSETERRLGW